MGLAEPMAKDAKGKGSADQALIRDLAELLEETGLSEIEIEREGMRVRVARQMTVAAPTLRGAPLPPHRRRLLPPHRPRAARSGRSIPASIQAPCRRRWSAPPTWPPSRALPPSSRSARA